MTFNLEELSSTWSISDHFSILFLYFMEKKLSKKLSHVCGGVVQWLTPFSPCLGKGLRKKCSRNMFFLKYNTIKSCQNKIIKICFRNTFGNRMSSNLDGMIIHYLQKWTGFESQD